MDFTALLPLRAATLSARTRTGDDAIGTSIKGGRVRVERILPPASGRGACTVIPLSDRLTLSDAVAFLDAL